MNTLHFILILLNVFSNNTMSFTFPGVISFEEIFHEHNYSVQVGFVSPFSLAYSILYKAATAWLQHELNPAVDIQIEVTISDASLN